LCGVGCLGYCSVRDVFLGVSAGNLGIDLVPIDNNHIVECLVGQEEEGAGVAQMVGGASRPAGRERPDGAAVHLAGLQFQEVGGQADIRINPAILPEDVCLHVGLAYLAAQDDYHAARAPRMKLA